MEDLFELGRIPNVNGTVSEWNVERSQMRVNSTQLMQMAPALLHLAYLSRTGICSSDGTVSVNDTAQTIATTRPVVVVDNQRWLGGHFEII